MRTIGCRIAQAALAAKHCNFWPADVDISDIALADRNCVGSAFRLLTKAGIIERLLTFERSSRESSGGRTVFAYRLVSAKLASTFIQRNGGALQLLADKLPVQQSLALPV